YKSVDAISTATQLDLVGVEEIGGKIAESVVDFFASEENRNIVKRLRDFGVQLEISAEELANQTDKLKNLTFVVSGVFETVSRDELKQVIENNGGKVSSSISSKTSYVVAGANMGPSKKQKAEALGVVLLNEEEFLQKIK